MIFSPGNQAVTVSGTVAVSSVAGTVATSQIGAGTATVTTVAQNVASVSLLAANAARLGGYIVNPIAAAATLFLRLDDSAAAAQDIPVAAGGYYEILSHYTGEIRGIWSLAGGSAATIVQFTA